MDMRIRFLPRYFIYGVIACFLCFSGYSYLEAPRKMPKKARVIKKTVYVSSKTDCEAGNGIYEPKRSAIKLPILMYHYVEEIKNPDDTIRRAMNVDPSILRQHLHILEQYSYTSVFVREIPEIIAGRSQTCVPAVAMTFDDGYESFYTYVFPLLKEYNVKATVYVITDFIGREGFLQEWQLKELVASGLVEIGAHTLSHLSLPAISTEEGRIQIRESKLRLEELLGTPVMSFAYPFGHFTPENARIVQEAGYTAAVTVEKGISYSGSDLFILPRIRPGSIEHAQLTVY